MTLSPTRPMPEMPHDREEPHESEASHDPEEPQDAARERWTTFAAPSAYAPLVEATRGDLVESVHYGAFAVTDPHGRVLASAGDPSLPFFARSTLKPLQLLAMLRAGLELPAELLALAAASHSGSQRHIDGAKRILEIHGLNEAALRNAVDLPYGASEREAHLIAGGGRSRLAQNCSGKHAAMVATCMINGWDRKNYLDPDHPLQRLIAATLSEMAGEEAGSVTTDGCGTPLFSYSLQGIARAYARLSASPAGTSASRVGDAMCSYPEMVGGEDRDVTALMRAVPGLIAKDGAEGVQVLGVQLRDARLSNIGIAIKIADGSDRARLPITLRILSWLGVSQRSLAGISSSPILGGGRAVGGLQVASESAGRLGDLGRFARADLHATKHL